MPTGTTAQTAPPAAPRIGDKGQSSATEEGRPFSSQRGHNWIFVGLDRSLTPDRTRNSEGITGQMSSIILKLLGKSRKSPGSKVTRF